MDAVERFAEEAARFERWARDGTDTGAAAVREALVRLTRLYLAALDLPPPWDEALNGQPDAARVGDDEWRAVFKAMGRLPVSYYGEVFDPLVVPPEEPVIGDVADDVADIYRDVVGGLREYEAGRRANAVYEWGYHFRIHWGDHATGAIRTLHAWLAANEPDALNAGRVP